MASNTQPKPIILGCEVKDKVTGFSGIVTMKHEMLGGNVMWGVQPRIVEKKDSKMELPEAISFDAHMLEVTGPGISAELPAIDNTCTIKPGEEVEDKITGFKGTATERVTFQNGCIYFSVEGPLTQKLPENLPKSKLFLHSRLKRRAVGVSKDERLVPPASTPTTPKRPPGGPSIRNAGVAYSRQA